MPRLLVFAIIVTGFMAGGVATAQQRPQAEELRQQVMERFLESYSIQAGLTSEQDQRFRERFQRSLRAREEMERRQRELWRALEGQMRPGFAANPDSVNQLMDQILAERLRMLEHTRTEQREYAAFLSPVQRAQLFIMWERFQRQIEMVRRRPGWRGGPPEPRRPEP